MRLLFVLVLLVAPRMSNAQDSPTLDAFTAAVEAKRAELIEVRHDIHRNPEISGMEKRTSSLVASRLRTLGWTVRQQIGGYGVVATLNGELPGERVVAFRADMDAVRSNEHDPAEYRSQIPGVRHICGHDVHATIGLTLAEGLSSIRSQFGGTVMLVFQPAEETASGAVAMLEDGAFNSITPDAIFAVHTTPYEVGQVATTPGGMMASRDRLTVTISGLGDIDAAAKEALEQVVSHNTVSREESFTSVPRNSIYMNTRPVQKSGDSRVIRSTVMLAESSVREKLVRELTESLNALNTEDTHVKFEYNRWIYGVTNDPEVTRRAADVARNILGSDNVIALSGIVPAFSEDFGSFQEVSPGTMFFLGVSNEAKGWVGMPHSPNYMADDEAIFVGARTMAAIMLDALAPS